MTFTFILGQNNNLNLKSILLKGLTQSMNKIPVISFQICNQNHYFQNSAEKYPVKGLFHREKILFPFLARCHGYSSPKASMLNIKMKLKIHISNRRK